MILDVSPVQPLHHAPPSTLSSAWAQLTEAQQHVDAQAEAVGAASTAAMAAEAKTALGRGTKAGSPVKAKACTFHMYHSEQCQVQIQFIACPLL